MNREADLQRILSHLAWLAVHLKLNSGQNFGTSATVLEDLCIPLLNLCYELQLTNINAEIPNAPAGDLICRRSRRAFQITINATTAKVRDVHEKAAALAPSADRLTIFFIVDGKLPGDPAGLTVCTAPVIDKLNLAGLITHIRSLSPERIGEIADLLDFECMPRRTGARTAGGTAVWITPTPARQLFGRVAESAEVRRLLEQSRRVAITGSGGKGKTALAAEVLRQLGPPPGHTGPWPRRLLLHDYYASPSHDAVLPGLLTQAAVDVTGLTTEAMTARLRTELSRPGTWLYLEGCEKAAALHRLMDLAGSATVLLTTREPHAPEGFTPFTLPPLSDADAADLIAFVVHSSGGGSPPVPPYGVHPLGCGGRPDDPGPPFAGAAPCTLKGGHQTYLPLARFLGGHALACRQAGNVMARRGWDPPELLHALRDRGLEALGGEQREHASIQFLLEHTWTLAATECPATADVWTLLAMGATAPVPWTVLESADRLAPADLSRALDVLQHLGIARVEPIISHDDGRTMAHWSLDPTASRSTMSPGYTAVTDVTPYPRDIIGKPSLGARKPAARRIGIRSPALTT